MGTFKLLCRDVIEALRPLPPDLFHGALCDPPYGLKFMGKKWDHGVPGPEYWAEVLRVLKPGAPILACGGARTYHRLACAIEDAGFEIFDSILGAVWIQGQGFPKSLDISKAIDKAAGAERHYRDDPRWADRYPNGPGGGEPSPMVKQAARKNDGPLQTSDPVTDDAKLWDGYGTALKPAWEPVVFARKPLSGTYAENCIEHGCGGLNIDGCRLAIDPQERTIIDNRSGSDDGDRIQTFGKGVGKREPGTKFKSHAAGRYPANLILSHHPECEDAGGCHPECPVAALDRQSGPRQAGRRPRVRNVNTKQYGGFTQGQSDLQGEELGGGGASRFFYTSKVSTAERNAGLGADRTNGHATLKPLSLTTYLAKLILPPPHVSSRLLVPFCGTGSEIAGALIAGWGHVVGIDNDPESIETARDRIPGLIIRGTK